MTRRRFIIGVTASLAALLLVLWILPLPHALVTPAVSSLRILDRNGVVLYDRRSGGLQRDVSLDAVPADITNALIATEDRSFWTNPGLSLRGIARAAMHDLNAGSIIEGGSTVTQQYVRTMLRPASRGLIYKTREAWFALKLTSRLRKKDILANFLNNAYFGQQSYGIAAAARTYFDKDLSALSLAESALLIGLLNAPTSLNPYTDPAAAKLRRDLVLQSMLAVGFITQEGLQEARSEPIRLTANRVPIVAPHFVMWQLQQHESEWTNLPEIRTTLDSSLQAEVQDIIDHQLDKLADKNVTSAAVVVLDAKNGDVLSMVGSRDYFDVPHDGAVNVATSPRQPGSAIKPFTYALALAKDMTAASTVADVETQYLTQTGTPYTPRNYDYGYHGLVRLREALANSYNIAAIKVLENVGVGDLVSFLRKLKFSTITDSPEHYGLALTLGDSEVPLLELARAYAIFPRGGKTLELRTTLQDTVRSGEQILPTDAAWLVADILSDNDARTAEFGRSSPLAFGFPVGAKTGTTRNSRDNWTIGFTPNRIVGVWVGNADNSPMRGTSGITGAGPIFHDVMIAAMRGIPEETFVRPPDIIDVGICRLSGMLITPLCPATAVEHFMKGTEPTVPDTVFRSVAVDTRNGLKAAPSCDAKFVRSDVFAFFPPEVQGWARDNGWKQPPVSYSPLCGRLAQSGALTSSFGATLHITSPGEGGDFQLDPLIPDGSEHITFEASADQSIQSVDWVVDGRVIGKANAPNFHFLWSPAVGTHHIEVKSGAFTDSLSITVNGQ